MKIIFIFFVIDISFPKNMHDTFEEFPSLVDKGIPPRDKTNKLMATLNDKKIMLFLYTCLNLY